jgi:hypothetical protein
MKPRKSPASRIALSSGSGNSHGRSAKPELVHSSAGSSPESVIPLDDDDFKEF